MSAARAADLAVALFTSGSTGGPKAVLHTQRGLAYKGRVMTRCHGLSMADSILMPAPLAHVSGLLNGLLVPEAQGGAGLGMLDMGVVLEEMGRMVHPGPFLSSAVGAVSAVALLGTSDQQAELLTGLAAGTTVATLASVWAFHSGQICMIANRLIVDTSVFDPFLERFVDRVLSRAGDPLVLDYVRLNTTARRRP